MIKPTHDEITRQARQLWQNRGCPSGCDLEIWLEAEWELSGNQAASGPARSTGGETALVGVAGTQPLLVRTEQPTGQDTLQKEEARAPKVPTHTGPKPVPAATGKPLWSRPHSS